jgi:hypothetical protein
MDDVISEAFRALADALTVPFLLALSLGATVVLTRTASLVYYAVQNRGRRPLVVRLDSHQSREQLGADFRSPDERLLAYLAADSQGKFVLAPGVGGPAAPDVATQASEPGSGWQTALLRMAVARQPSYGVEVSWSRTGHADTRSRYEAVVRIARIPGNRIVAAGSFSKSTEEKLIQLVGCFCITFLRSQPRILCQTPRWELWSQDIEGYHAYRKGLECRQRAEAADSKESRHDAFQQAIRYLNIAARSEFGNLFVQLQRAALLELIADYQAAVDIYRRCNTLWPEHIETVYRLVSARKNLPNNAASSECKRVLQLIKDQLKIWGLVRFWYQTLKPWRWNPGERRYWGSWLQLQLPGRPTKRADYLNAIAISERLADLSALLDPPQAGGDIAESRNGAGKRGLRTIEDLMKDVAGILLRRRAARESWVLLLRPQDTASAPRRREKHSRKAPECPGGYGESRVNGESRLDQYQMPAFMDRRYRRIGGLATYNAACFFSRAIDLPEEQVPSSYENPDDWGTDCALAAIRELGMLTRNHRHSLAPGWLWADPDLKPLRTSPAGDGWKKFIDPFRPEAATLRDHYKSGRRQVTMRP